MNYSYALLLHHTSANKFTLDPSTSGATGGMTVQPYTGSALKQDVKCMTKESCNSMNSHPKIPKLFLTCFYQERNILKPKRL